VAASAILAAALLFCSSLQQAEDPEALWAAGKRAESIQVLTARLQANPDQEPLRTRLAEQQLAVHWYAAALETLAPLGDNAGALRARALFLLGRWEEAIPGLARDDPAQLLMRIEALEALGRDPEAEADLARARELLGEEDARLLVYQARAHARAGRWPEAIADFRRALESDPLDGAALFGLGRALISSGERDEGIAVLTRHRALTPLLDQLDFARRSLDLAPLHAANHAAVGDAERALGRIEAAQAAYARALELASGEELVPIALRQARLLAEDRTDVDAAVSALESAAARFPDARLFVRSGDLLLAAGRPVDAVQRYLRARELRPDDAQIAQRIEKARAAYDKGADK
jgi:tetratricopeptide (TPR) repeat protein